MHRYRHLMVGLANSPTDAALIAYSAMVARLGTAEKVSFVHVLPNSAGVPPGSDHGELRRTLQNAAESHFAGVPNFVQVSYEVVAGPLVDRLLTHIAEKQVDLFLLGDRPGPTGRRALVRRLAMKAPCSVWLVPEEATPKLRRLLVPIDFSEPAADALRVATSIASCHRHAECLALHVYFNEAAITYEEYDLVLRGQEEQSYRQFVAPIDCCGVRVTPLFEEGPSVVHVIERVAQQHDVDAIVMATRGRSRSSAILLGSVAEEMILATRVPLLVVKHFGARMGVLQALLDRRFWHKGALHMD